MMGCASMRLARLLGVTLVAMWAAPAATLAAQPPGPDGQGSDFFVTIGARQCLAYPDIRANRARNNIQESLRDIGGDSPYTPGQAVVPWIEGPTQPRCSPITGWRLTLGTGIG